MSQAFRQSFRRRPTTFALTACAFTLALGAGLMPAPVAAAPVPVSTVTAPGLGLGDSLPFEAAVFLGCDKLPAGKQAVKLTVTPEIAVGDLLGPMSALSCAPIHIAAGVAPDTKVRLAGPRLVSAQQAFSLMDAALTDAGLSLQAEKSATAQFELVIKPRSAPDQQ
jgi:hypothetical protein